MENSEKVKELELRISSARQKYNEIARSINSLERVTIFTEGVMYGGAGFARGVFKESLYNDLMTSRKWLNDRLKFYETKILDLEEKLRHSNK